MLLVRVAGLLMSCAGLLGLRDLLVARHDRLLPPPASTTLMFLGPGLLAIGVLIFALNPARNRPPQGSGHLGASLLALGTLAAVAIAVLSVLEGSSPERFGLLFTVALVVLGGPALVLLLAGALLVIRASRTASRRG